jgi:hypothetical protein
MNYLSKTLVSRNNVRIFRDITPDLDGFIPGISACEQSAMRSVKVLSVHNLVYLSCLYFTYLITVSGMNRMPYVTNFT